MDIALKSKSKSSKAERRNSSKKVFRPITHRLQVQERLRLYGFEVDIKVADDQPVTEDI